MNKLILLFTFCLYTLTASFSEEILEEVLNYYENEEYINIIKKLEIAEDLTPELTYFLTESYLFAITDAPSWMKYNTKYQDIIVKCLEEYPENILYQINSARGMMWFPSPRGNKDDGIELILKLEKENPSHPNVIYAASSYKFGEGLVDEAKKGYLEVLKIDPTHKRANETLKIIELDEKNLEIRNITFIDNNKTNEKRLSKKISEYRGATLDKDNRQKISTKLMQISSINGANIKGTQVDDVYVDLEIEVIEEDTKILMFQQVSGAGLDFNDDILPSGLMPPVTIFIDNNFLGTGSRFQLITVFVFNQLDFYIPGLINDKYLDFNLNITSMLLPTENNSYVKGEVIDGTKQTNSNHALKAGFGRTFSFNLSTFVYYQANFDFHEELRDNITPNHLITHSVSSEILFSTAGTPNTAFDLLEGMSFCFIPTVSYKQDYKPWGDPNNLREHDDNASLNFVTSFGYYKNLNTKNNLSVLGAWYVNHNPYESDRFAFGHRGDATTFNSLTGYLPGEILFDNGILLNVKHTITPKANRVNIYTKYDVVFDIENSKFYNGVALGGAVKLPWDLDLKGEFGIGLNAIRDGSPGIFISLELSKLVLF